MTKRHLSSRQETASTPQGPGRTGRAVAGARWVITVLFCDIVGSTAMAERLDPEEWTEIMNEAFQYLTAPIQRYEGTVARLMGDAILAFFGAPVAHEDDPQRAVLAALDIIDGIRPFGDQLAREYGLDFTVRVGINTGPVVVADVGSDVAKKYTAMGDAVNVAARMEQSAQPGTVQISGETHRLVAPLFDFEPLGEVGVKGESEPVLAYRVLGAKAQPGRLRGIDAVSAPLIGRDSEFAQLKGALESLRKGLGQIVCLIGEAGLGKSRMLEELRTEWLRDNEQSPWVVSHGNSYDTMRPYGLFQQRVREFFGSELDDPVEVIHQKVSMELRAQGMPEELIVLCAAAAKRIVAAKVLHDTSDLAADALKEEVYEQMDAAWRRFASTGPLVLVFDDLHWANPASAELLVHLLQLTEEVPILFLFAFRPERQSPAWRLKLKAEADYPHRYTEIVLNLLGPEDTDTLVSALLSVADLPPELRQLILRKTEGNPYFAEEIVRTLIKQGVVYRTEDGLRWKAGSRVEDIAIPDSLHALLTARIDRLDREVRATLHVASVIGRSFYYRVLNAISDTAIELDEHLMALQRLQLVGETARIPELEYMFKHELARDAAYRSILHRRRREFHRSVGEAIQELFPDKLEENAHRLAFHFAEAGDDEWALKYYTMAGEAAAAIYANAEAAAQYPHAIEAAGRLGVSGEDLSGLIAMQRQMLELSGRDKQAQQL